MDIDFTKEKKSGEAPVLASHESAHGVLRKAIEVASPDDSIVISLEYAMALMIEWNERG